MIFCAVQILYRATHRIYLWCSFRWVQVPGHAWKAMAYLFICMPICKSGRPFPICGGRTKSSRLKSKPHRPNLCLICLLNAWMQKRPKQCKSLIPQRFYCSHNVFHKRSWGCVCGHLTGHGRQVPHAADDRPAAHHSEQIVHHPELTAVPERLAKPRVILCTQWTNKTCESWNQTNNSGL